MDVSVIIPTLNEEQSIRQVLAEIPWEDISEVIVVDGGSLDRTAEIASEMGARVIHESRRGYGQACAIGVAHAYEDIVVFMDGDGADDPALIPALVKPIRMGQAEMVLGSRLAGTIAPGAMPWHQRFGNQLSAFLIRLLYKIPLSDLSPFRAVHKQNLLSLKLREMTYGYPTEMIAKAARRGWRMTEIPVNYRSRLGGVSKISGTIRGTVLATYYIFKVIFRYASS